MRVVRGGLCNSLWQPKIGKSKASNAKLLVRLFSALALTASVTGNVAALRWALPRLLPAR